MSALTKQLHHPDNYLDLLKKHRLVDPVVLEAEVQFLNKKRSNSLYKRAEQTTTGLEPYIGAWTDTEKMHLLRRTLFGVKKSDLKALDGLGISESVALLLTQNTSPSPPVNDYNDPSQGYEDPDVPYGDTWILAGRSDEFEGYRVVSLKNWLIAQKINQPTTIEEKLLFFFHMLIPTKAWDIFHARLSYRYFEKIRNNMFGNYKKMIKEVTIDPAMLLFLNGTFNEKDAPDENYARELQELFCIGKGPNANYTESDIQAAAKVLTGWRIDWSNWESGEIQGHFEDWAHDTSDKTFSSFYGNRVIEGRTGSEGAEELDALLDMIFDNEETSLYICRRIYQFFVYHDIDDAVEKNVIEPLAQVFRDNNYDIKPVLTTLLASQHFFDPLNFGTQITNPVEHQIGLWKTLGMKGLVEEDPVFPDDLDDLRAQHSSILWRMSRHGLEIADPPNVSGWPAYYQAPSFDKYWITTDTITDRGRISDAMVAWGLWMKQDVHIPVDLKAFLKTLAHPEDPVLMLKEASLLLHGLSPAQETFDSLKATLLTGQDKDHYWTDAWMEYLSDPTNSEAILTVENRLKPVFQRLLQLGETYLM